MRRFIFAVVTACVAYFVVGFILVKLGYFPEDEFYSYAVIVGGLASVCGLLAFGLPRLRTSDIQAIELDSLQRAAHAAGEIEKREKELTYKEKEIIRLKLQKEEMEFLVRKASLQLFLESQAEQYIIQINELIDQNKELAKILEDLPRIREKLRTLGEEIQCDKNVNLLLEIVEEARAAPKLFSRFPEPYRTILQVVDNATDGILRNFIR